MVKDRSVKVEANDKVTNIKPTSVTFERDGQTMTLECDTVLNAVGFRPNNQLEDLLDEKYGYDAKEIILDKIITKGKKYPIDKSKGNAKKYSEL